MLRVISEKNSEGALLNTASCPVNCTREYQPDWLDNVLEGNHQQAQAHQARTDLVGGIDCSFGLQDGLQTNREYHMWSTVAG